jgi:DNA polymerase III sliding clamp (beta) subunit (PCNA family)
MAQTEAVFSVAELADAVSRAARVAPTKGAAFDKAAGIIIDLDVVKARAELRATDLETSFFQSIQCISATGPSLVWRVSSLLLDGFLQSLPKREDDTVALIGRGDDKIRLRCGKTVIALQLLPVTEFPSLGDVPVFEGTPANEVAAKVEQVAWSVDLKRANLSGVYIDGTRMIACDGFTLCSIPCQVGVDKPILVPMQTLKSLLKQASDVRMATNGPRIYVSLDAETVVSSSLIMDEFPKVDPLMVTDFGGTLSFRKTAFQDCMNRLNTMARQDRLPAITLTLGTSGMLRALIFDVAVKGVGRIRDELDITTDCEVEYVISFQPAHLEKAVEACQGDTVSLDFAPGGEFDKPKQIRIRDDKDFQCWIVPRTVPT